MNCLDVGSVTPLSLKEGRWGSAGVDEFDELEKLFGAPIFMISI